LILKWFLAVNFLALDQQFKQKLVFFENPNESVCNGYIAITILFYIQ